MTFTESGTINLTANSVLLDPAMFSTSTLMSLIFIDPLAGGRTITVGKSEFDFSGVEDDGATDPFDWVTCWFTANSDVERVSEFMDSIVAGRVTGCASSESEFPICFCNGSVDPPGC